MHLHLNRTYPDGRVRLSGISSGERNSKVKNASKTCAFFVQFYCFFDKFVDSPIETVGKSNLQNKGRVTFEVGTFVTSAHYVEL